MTIISETLNVFGYKKVSGLFILGSLLLMVSCHNGAYFRSIPTYISYKKSPSSILNRALISTKSALMLHRMGFKQSPSTDEERVAVAEFEISKAKNSFLSSPETRAIYYLKAAKTLWTVVKNNPFPRKWRRRGNKKCIRMAHELYDHATGQLARILVSSGKLNKTKTSLILGGEIVHVNTASSGTLHPSYFDEIYPIDGYVYGSIGGFHYYNKGLGSAVIAHRAWSEARSFKDPLLPPVGFNIPVNVIIDFEKGDEARITFYDLLKTNSTQITGVSRILAADYSAAVAATMSSQSSFLGLSLALNPSKHKGETGLFSLEAYDPNKIPVIFVHGLISQPSTWRKSSNYLLANKRIRDNYQFFYYFYPTSMTPIISGAKFKKRLLLFYKRHHSRTNRKLNRTVLIGHSMGGLLSSIQSRKFDQKLYDSIFKKAPHEGVGKSVYAEYEVLFHPSSLKQIQRTIFIATPHRGSKLANNWIGRVGSSLISLPQNILSLQLGKTAESMTELGRSLLNTDSGPPNSISRLKANNPALSLLVNQAFNQRITYHSIMGDRGKNNGGSSSDGVVPYWSSHLDGAKSELFVPSYHNAHMHPAAQKEMARILLLHLQANDEAKKIVRHAH